MEIWDGDHWLFWDEEQLGHTNNRSQVKEWKKTIRWGLDFNSPLKNQEGGKNPAESGHLAERRWGEQSRSEVGREKQEGDCVKGPSREWKPFEANCLKHSSWFYLIYRGFSSACNPRGHLAGNSSSQIFIESKSSGRTDPKREEWMVALGFCELLLNQLIEWES